MTATLGRSAWRLGRVRSRPSTNVTIVSNSCSYPDVKQTGRAAAAWGGARP